MMTLSGVRSSCDMVATNSDLSRLAACKSAMSRAFSSAIAVACAMPAARRRCRQRMRRARAVAVRLHADRRSPRAPPARRARRPVAREGEVIGVLVHGYRTRTGAFS